MWYKYIMGYYSALIRKKILSFVKMKLEDIMLSEINQAQKGRVLHYLT